MARDRKHLGQRPHVVTLLAVGIAVAGGDTDHRLPITDAPAEVIRVARKAIFEDGRGRGETPRKMTSFGCPLALLEVRTGAIRSDATNKDLFDSTAKSTRSTLLWLVPIYVRGRLNGVIEVGQPTGNGELRYCGWFGVGGFAATLVEISEVWPNQKGYHPVIFKIGHIYAAFHVPEVSDTNLTPFTWDDHWVSDTTLFRRCRFEKAVPVDSTDKHGTERYPDRYHRWAESGSLDSIEKSEFGNLATIRQFAEWLRQSGSCP